MESAAGRRHVVPRQPWRGFPRSCRWAGSQLVRHHLHRREEDQALSRQTGADFTDQSDHFKKLIRILSVRSSRHSILHFKRKILFAKLSRLRQTVPLYDCDNNCIPFQEGRLFLIGTAHFESLVELIHYYERHPLYRKVKLVEGKTSENLKCSESRLL